MTETLSSTLCAASSCGHASCVSLEGRDFCREHFIANCYRRIEDCGKQLHQNEHWKRSSGEPFIQPLLEIVDRTATLGLIAKDLDTLEQAQLLDILFSAGSLLQNLRRSVRKFASLPLRLCYEVTGRNWSEETTTQEISLHGASMECRIPIAKGEMMNIERTDVHRGAQAKVRWQKRRTDGTQLIGIELLGCADFWGFTEA
jgi:hypothetical protein